MHHWSVTRRMPTRLDTHVRLTSFRHFAPSRHLTLYLHDVHGRQTLARDKRPESSARLISAQDRTFDSRDGPPRKVTLEGVIEGGARRIGVLTGGGDCPGLNAAIRAVVMCAENSGDDVIGFHHGWRGVAEGESAKLTLADTKGLLQSGGTILR